MNIRYMSYDQRKELETMYAANAEINDIAARLGVNHVTVYRELKHGETGEFADEELDNVSGGACYTDDGYLLTTIGHKCKHFEEKMGHSGIEGTCCACKYWDYDIPSSFEIFGSPLRCLNPKNKR